MEKTPLSEIFRGQLRTRTVKNGENEPTENIEPFFTLKLDIEVFLLIIHLLKLNSNLH